MTSAAHPPRDRADLRDHVVYLAGIFGLAASLTALWLGMRSVMNIGGACASGGAYTIAVECPSGVDLVLFLSVPIGIGCVAIIAWKGITLSSAYAAVAALAWPALFVSLGWNFLEYALRPPDGSGEIVWGWLIPGVIFMIMGIGPALAWLTARRQGTRLAGVPGSRTPLTTREIERAVRFAESEAARLRGQERDASRGDAAGGAGPESPSARTLVGQLERLHRLHRSGGLSDEEFEDAKRTLLAAAARGEAV